MGLFDRLKKAFTGQSDKLEEKKINTDNDEIINDVSEQKLEKSQIENEQIQNELDSSF